MRPPRPARLSRPSGPLGVLRDRARRWRPVEARPGEGWEVLPPLRWVVLGGAAALVVLIVTVAVALHD